MSPQDLDELATLFRQACDLNREALARLAQGAEAASLAALFERKAALLRRLGELQPSLRTPGSQGSDKNVSAALEAQREAAASEAQLAEALGNAIPQFGKVARAYKNLGRLTPKNSLDSSG